MLYSTRWLQLHCIEFVDKILKVNIQMRATVYELSSKMVGTFECMDVALKCDHTNESYNELTTALCCLLPKIML